MKRAVGKVSLHTTVLVTHPDVKLFRTLTGSEERQHLNALGTQTIKSLRMMFYKLIAMMKKKSLSTSGSQESPVILIVS